MGILINFSTLRNFSTEQIQHIEHLNNFKVGQQANDGSLGDGSLGDGSLGNGSLGDGSLGDGSLGDGSLGDGYLGDWSNGHIKHI